MSGIVIHGVAATAHPPVMVWLLQPILLAWCDCYSPSSCHGVAATAYPPGMVWLLQPTLLAWCGCYSLSFCRGVAATAHPPGMVWLLQLGTSWLTAHAHIMVWLLQPMLMSHDAPWLPALQVPHGHDVQLRGLEAHE